MKKVKSFVAVFCAALLMLTLNLPILSTNNSGMIIAQAAQISINKTSKTLTKGQTYKLKVTGTTKEVKWTSSNKKVATVSSSGNVTAKSTGTATITAKIGEKKLTCKITVKKSNKSKSTKKTSKKVYWTDSGEVYHSSSSCRTLSRSKNINSGTNPPANRRACKVCC